MSVGPSKELQAGSSTSGLTSAGPPHEDRPDYTSSKDPIGAYSSVPAKPKRRLEQTGLQNWEEVHHQKCSVSVLTLTCECAELAWATC